MRQFLLSLVVAGLTHATPAADPRTNSWFTTYSGKYARIYTTDANKTTGTAVTTWSNGTQTQSSPAYAGVQAVYSSASWVYVKSSGLAQHTMGPWLNGNFPNLPKNQNALYRIPRNPTVPASKTLTGLGTIGYFADGVSMFDSRDGFVWTGSTESGNGTGYWQREAYVNEGATFDPGYAHQENTGNHHYHANPVALRYLLGDHVDFNTATKTYSESTNAVTKHSPILAWVRDGFPVYGPYGYSSASNAASGIRRMTSGYVLRNGQNGTLNLAATGRTNLPAWAVRAYNVSAAQTGPSDFTAYPLGRYMEDNEYLGDLGKVQGVDFDLDEYNGRWCVTPEFPNGTYAYFVSINSNGTPVFPYNIGRAYYGSPTGSSTTLAEVVTTNFLGGGSLSEKLSSPARSGNNLVLTWSGLEGGTYRIEAENSLSASNWTALATNVLSGSATGSFTETNGAASSQRFYRVARTALATYDGGSTTTTGSNGILSVSPASHARDGVSFTLTINLDPAVGPPPQTAPINFVMVGTNFGTGNTHVTSTQVTSTIKLEPGAASGPQTVLVQFPGAPPNPTPPVTFALTNGFMIN